MYGDVDDQNDTWIKYFVSPGEGGYFDVDSTTADLALNWLVDHFYLLD